MKNVTLYIFCGRNCSLRNAVMKIKRDGMIYDWIEFTSLRKNCMFWVSSYCVCNMAAGNGVLTSAIFFRLLMICCKFLTLLFIALLLSDPFIMLTRNAKTSMTWFYWKGRQHWKRRWSFEHWIRFSCDSERDAPDTGANVFKQNKRKETRNKRTCLSRFCPP